MYRAARLFARACLPVGMGFDRQDLLRQAGYDEGDFLPQFALVTSKNSAKTSSDTYTPVLRDGEGSQPRLNLTTIYPDSVTPAAYLAARVSAGGDQIDVRVATLSGNNVYIERTGLTLDDGQFEEGPTPYTPADNLESITLQIRNNNDTTTVAIVQVGILFGVQL